MGQPFIDQDSFGFYQDNNANPDLTTIIGSVNVVPTVSVDTNINLRFLMQNTGAKDYSDDFEIWGILNGGTPFQITTSSTICKILASNNWSDGDSVGQRIGAGGYDEGYTDSNGVMTSFTLGQSPNNESELVWNVQFISTDLVGTDSLVVEVRDANGTQQDAYTNTITITSWSGFPSQDPFTPLIPTIRRIQNSSMLAR